MGDDFRLDKALWLLENDYILHLREGEIWKIHSLGEDYYKYRSYGESATDATKDGLKWIFETIFKSYDYIAFRDWYDISINFLANNERSMWIFTDGQFPYKAYC